MQMGVCRQLNANEAKRSQRKDYRGLPHSHGPWSIVGQYWFPPLGQDRSSVRLPQGVRGMLLSDGGAIFREKTNAARGVLGTATTIHSPSAVPGCDTYSPSSSTGSWVRVCRRPSL